MNPDIARRQLAKALLPVDGLPQTVLPLLERQGDKLVLNLRGVMFLLFQMPEFKDRFAPGEDSGFVRDVQDVPRGTTARVGGRLLQGSEGPLSHAVEKLRDAAAADAALAGIRGEGAKAVLLSAAQAVQNALDAGARRSSTSRRTSSSCARCATRSSSWRPTS